jgi:hypothetical protein
VRAWPWWPWVSRLSPGLAGSGVSVSARRCSILSANHRVCFGSSLPSGKCALRYSAAKRSDNFDVIGDRHFQPPPPRSPSISMGHQLAAPARHFALCPGGFSVALLLHSVVPLAALQPPSPPDRCRPSPCDRLSRPRSTTATPPRPARSADGAPIPTRHAGCVPGWEPTPDGSRVHCCSLDRGGARLCTSGLATATPQSFTMAFPAAGFTAAEKFPADGGDAPLPAHIHQIRAGIALRGVTAPVPRVLLSTSLTGPTPSGSADAPRLCQGCSHPPRHLPDQAAPSYARPLRRPDGDGLSPPPEQQRLTAHEASTQRLRDHLRRPIRHSGELLIKTAGNTVSEIDP